MAERTIETAEGLDQASSVQASIQGALKSASSNNERAKRASAVRFADQVQMAQDEAARLEASQETDEDVMRQSMQASLQEGEVQSPTAKKQPKAKVKGRQLVGSQEIASDSGASSGGGSGTGEEDKKDNEDESGEEGEGGDEEKSGAEEAEEEGDEVESGSVNSARERARASGMTIDTGKSPEEEKVTGDQKVIEVESGPLYDQKVAVNERIFLARVAEQGGSDDDMVEYVIDLFRKKDKQKVKIEGNPKPQPADYTRSERNLIHVSFKTLIAKKRVIIRTLDAIQENPKYTRYDRKIKEYQKKLKEEIIADCSHFLDMLHAYCIDRAGNGPESETFFLVLAADLTRYICEQTPSGPKMKELKINTTKLYERAERKCERLHYCSAVRMSRDLHHANFAHEFLNDTSLALKIAEASVLKAQATLHTTDEDTYVEANHLMELLKENQAIWKGQDPTMINVNADMD